MESSGLAVGAKYPRKCIQRTQKPGKQIYTHLYDVLLFDYHGLT